MCTVSSILARKSSSNKRDSREHSQARPHSKESQSRDFSVGLSTELNQSTKSHNKPLSGTGGQEMTQQTKEKPEKEGLVISSQMSQGRTLKTSLRPTISDRLFQNYNSEKPRASEVKQSKDYCDSKQIDYKLLSSSGGSHFYQPNAQSGEYSSKTTKLYSEYLSKTHQQNSSGKQANPSHLNPFDFDKKSKISKSVDNYFKKPPTQEGASSTHSRGLSLKEKLNTGYYRRKASGSSSQSNSQATSGVTNGLVSASGTSKGNPASSKRMSLLKQQASALGGGSYISNTQDSRRMQLRQGQAGGGDSRSGGRLMDLMLTRISGISGSRGTNPTTGMNMANNSSAQNPSFRHNSQERGPTSTGSSRNDQGK